MSEPVQKLAERFRGYLPVVVDLETGGFDHQTNPVLELACAFVGLQEGMLVPTAQHCWQVVPFAGAQIDPASLKVTGIDPSDPARNQQFEKDVLNELARMNRKEVCLGWGDYENSVAFYVELQFYAPDAGGQDRYVCTDQRNEDLFAFKKAPPNGKLLSPAEDRPYARGPQEVQLLNGKAEMQFSFNVINKDLNNAHKKKLFCLTAHCLNPYLNGRANFTATSVPFMIKRSLHNDLVKTDRWVLDETGTKVKVDKSLVTRLAPTRKLAFARKRKADEEPAEGPAEEDDSEGE